MIAALRTVAPGVGASELEFLASPQPPSIQLVLTTLLNDLGSTGSDIVLVLDDYHLIDALEVQDAMAFLLDHVPPQLHLVIASRADPAVPLARRRARGELVATAADRGLPVLSVSRQLLLQALAPADTLKSALDRLERDVSAVRRKAFSA